MSPSTVAYDVESPDFATAHDWETIGVVTIDLDRRSYRFVPQNVLANQKVVPPHVYVLSGDQLERELHATYEGHGHGAWTSRINRRVTELIERDEYPETVY